MIVGIGVDVVGIARFTELMQRTPGAVGRVLTHAEQHTGEGQLRSAESLAARFAAKEAVAKALGSPGKMEGSDCQIITDASGQPRINVTGTVAAAAQMLNITRWHLSLSHDAGVAIAYVVAEA